MVPLLLLAALLCGCSRHMLDVRSQYLTPEYLASNRVDTPDPCKRCFVGQEVIVRWRVPRELKCEDMHLAATFRYISREMEDVVVPLKGSCGYWKWRLLNDAYLRTCGILSYKIDLYVREEIVASWRHHLWCDIIDL